MRNLHEGLLAPLFKLAIRFTRFDGAESDYHGLNLMGVKRRRENAEEKVRNSKGLVLA